MPDVDFKRHMDELGARMKRILILVTLLSLVTLGALLIAGCGGGGGEAQAYACAEFIGPVSDDHPVPCQSPPRGVPPVLDCGQVARCQ